MFWSKRIHQNLTKSSTFFVHLATPHLSDLNRNKPEFVSLLLLLLLVFFFYCAGPKQNIWDPQVFVSVCRTLRAFVVSHLLSAISLTGVCSWACLLIKAAGQTWNEQLRAVCTLLT